MRTTRLGECHASARTGDSQRRATAQAGAMAASPSRALDPLRRCTVVTALGATRSDRTGDEFEPARTAIDRGEDRGSRGARGHGSAACRPRGWMVARPCRRAGGLDAHVIPCAHRTAAAATTACRRVLSSRGRGTGSGRADFHRHRNVCAEYRNERRRSTPSRAKPCACEWEVHDPREPRSFSARDHGRSGIGFVRFQRLDGPRTPCICADSDVRRTAGHARRPGGKSSQRA